MLRIWTAYTVEVLKATRARSTYFGPLLVAIAVLCSPFLYRFSRDGISDYNFIASATPMALNVIGFLMIVTFCASLISAELSSGTIRTILVRPIRRWEVVMAKFLLGMTYAATLTLIVAVLTWTLAHFFGELRGVGVGGEILHTNRNMLHVYAIGMALNLAPQAATVAYGLMISSFFRNTGTAIAVALGLWIALDTLKYALQFAPVMFTSYLDVPWTVFENFCSGIPATWFPGAGKCLGVTLVSAGAFLVAGIIAVQRRNLQG